MAKMFLPTIIASLRLSSSVFRHVFHSCCQRLRSVKQKVEISLSLFFQSNADNWNRNVVITDNKQTNFTCLKSNEASFANVTLTHLHNKSMRLWIRVPNLSVTIYKRYSWIMACTHVNLIKTEWRQLFGGSTCRLKRFTLRVLNFNGKSNPQLRCLKRFT